MELKGKVAVITGGAAGMGRAVAERLLKEGARVVLWDLSREALDKTIRELSSLGDVRGYDLDVSNRGAVAAAAKRMRAEVGRADILDNNAGVVYGGDFLTCPEETLQRTVDVNLTAVMWCIRELLPDMIAKGNGHIIMMSSACGLLGVPGLAAYAATKHAVIGLAESIRLELAANGHKGIGMTIVCPSFVNTGMFSGVKPPLLTPWLTPEVMAEKIVSAMKRNRLYVREPFMVKLVPVLKGFAGTALLDLLGRLLGMNSSMAGFRGRAPKP